MYHSEPSLTDIFRHGSVPPKTVFPGVFAGRTKTKGEAREVKIEKFKKGKSRKGRSGKEDRWVGSAPAPSPALRAQCPGTRRLATPEAPVGSDHLPPAAHNTPCVFSLRVLKWPSGRPSLCVHPGRLGGLRTLKPGQGRSALPSEQLFNLPDGSSVAWLLLGLQGCAVCCRRTSELPRRSSVSGVSSSFSSPAGLRVVRVQSKASSLSSTVRPSASLPH